MARTVGRRDRWLAPLLILCFATGAAAAQSTLETTWKTARGALLERGAFAEADKLIADALAKPPSAGDRWYWELRVLRGATQGAKQAIPWLERIEPPPQSAAEVRRLVNLGLAYGSSDSRSIALFETALRLAKRHPDVQAEVNARYAALLARRDDYVRAEEHARRALKLIEEHGDRQFEPFALNQLAYDLGHQERYGEGLHWSEKLLTVAGERRLDFWIQKAEGNLGWMYLELGDYETAAELFERAAQTATRIGSAVDRVIWTNQRGNVALQMRDYASAAKYCGDAAALAVGTQEDVLGHALANLARVAIETNRLADAERHNDKALEVKRAREDAPGVQRSLILSAQIASLRGRHDEAIAKLGEIAKSKDLSVRWEAQGRLAEVLVRAKRNAAAESAFRNAVSTIGEVRKNLDSNLRIAFFRVAEDVFDAYVDFLVADGRRDEALQVTELVRAATLEEGLRIAAPKKLDPAALARARRATILCYWLGRERSYVWVITPAGTALKELGRRDRDIEKAVDAYQRSLRNTRLKIPQLRPQAEELWEMLVKPAGIARQARVIVVPDGRLHVLNFESLMVPGETPRFWIQDVTVVSAGSLQLLDRKTTGSTAKANAMLLIGDPRRADPAYPPLPKAKTEIAKVQRHFPRPVVLESEKATPANYRASAPGAFEYLHFVAHGEATRRKPLDAAVILGKDAAGGYKLFARDIVRQPLGARLVTISACYGAGTRTFVGEGLVGLAWAFLSAGAQQVVAALWEVSDAAAPELMDDMYAAIRAGRDPATALREAKLKLVGKGTKPFYWAPFVLYGGV